MWSKHFEQTASRSAEGAAVVQFVDYTREALLVRHLCVKSESRKHSTKIYIVRHSTKPRFNAHTSGLISWKISAKAEMFGT